jgi:hypothetical protein
MAMVPTMITARLHVGTMVMLASLALAATAAAPAPAATRPAAKAPAFALLAAGDSGSRVMRASPGRTLRGAVIVRNVSSRRVTVRLQPADIRNAANGNADYITTRLAQAGRWLKLSATTVRLSPKSSRLVAFTVRVPANARGASHYAGIVAVDASELATAKAPRKRSTKRTGFSFSRINRQALPITIRLPGPLKRKLTLRNVKLDVQPAGAGLMLGLQPRGSVLMQDAKVRLRVSRGTRTILKHASTLGQLFPGSKLDYRIAWKGQPTEGSYRVKGVIRPRAAKPVYIDQSVKFTPAKAKELKRETPPVATAPGAGTTPPWVWIALAGGAALLLALLFVIWKLARRRPVAPAV